MIDARFSVASHFWRNAIENPEKTAFASNGNASITWLCWRELGQLAAEVIQTLQLDGLKAGEHVSNCLPNSLAWILLDIAAQTMGLVHVAIDPRESPQRQHQLAEFSRSRLLIADPNWPSLARREGTCLPLTAEECRAMALSINLDAPAQMLFTSGSLAEPKGVLLSHRNLVSNALAKLTAAPQYEDDLRLNILPFAHAYARTCELTSWILSRSRLALASSWMELLRIAPRLQPTLLNVVPFLAEQAAQALEANSRALGGRVRLLQCGGAALPSELWWRLQSLGLPPLQGYGLTEASPVVCSNIAGLQKPGSVGPAVDGIQIRLDAEQVLWCHGPNVMLGYWRDAEATQHCIRDGWLCTGDIAEITADGMVSILGRASQQLTLSTGYKVSPEFVERELLAIPGIDRAVVLGEAQPHVVALIWPSAAYVSPIDLRAKIERQLCHLPRYAIPFKFSIMSEALSQATATLTTKGTPRRQQIAERYQSVISQLFASGNA